MAKFADVFLNQLKVISKAAGALLSYEDETTITLYHVQQSPVIFRAVMKKDLNDQFRLFLRQLPSSIPLKAPLKEDMDPKLLEELSNRGQPNLVTPLLK